MQTVYVDVLIVLNSLIGFFLLLITSVFLKCSPSGGRMIAGTVMGGVYSLIILAPDMGFFLSLVVKFLMCVTVVYAVFRPKSVRYLIKCLGIFYGVNLLFAGVMTGIKTVFSPDELQIHNSAVYFDFGFFSLVIAAAVCYVSVLIFNALTPKRVTQSVYTVTLYGSGGKVECRGIVDTGNSLTDPFTGECVTVTDIATADAVMSSSESEFVHACLLSENGVCTVTANGCRVIPAVTVNGKGLMPVFHVVKAEITDGVKKYEISNGEIGVSSVAFGDGTEILINPYMLNESGRVKNEKTGNADNKTEEHCGKNKA